MFLGGMCRAPWAFANTEMESHRDLEAKMRWEEAERPALDVISSPSWTRCLDEFCGTDVSVCAVRVIVPVYSVCHQHPGHSVFA